ncbi:DUF2244 domain-containing protein [Pseudoroseicyclus sp. CXY001]|uniref:DUF2244 domain-containing protein n=1 Tax=Pseudoroseicyclus sp. CXY001 TaxID=3242492 RepID=UPI003570B7EE
MPYAWVRDFEAAPDASSGAVSHQSHAQGDPPCCELTLWPNNSLAPSGFVTFIVATTALMTLPLMALLGTPVLWVLLAFLLAALAGIWWALRANAATRERLSEHLRIWEDKLHLTRRDPSGVELSFEANPYWVEVKLHKAGGPSEDYLTLKGAGRVVELGAFLAPEERRQLAGDLELRLARVRHGARPAGRQPPPEG